MTASDQPAQVGRRVVVRYRRPQGSQPPLTDVVGVVIAADAQRLTVDGSRGPVTVRRQDVVVVREVPPAPVRRGRPQTALSTVDLERLMADGWRAVEEQWFGDWLLRASSGFTGRGNSVLPLGDPGLERADAIHRAEEWYAARDLPPRFHLDVPPSGDPADDPLGSALLGRGYYAESPTLVMTGATTDAGPSRHGATQVGVAESLTPQWQATYARQRSIVPGVTEQLLTGSARQRFLSTADQSGSLTAVARVTLHPGWAGLQGLWVDPELRGRGLGRTVVRAAATLARQQRIPSMYLQVGADNDAAVTLYESEGFRTHHLYCYLLREA